MMNESNSIFVTAGGGGEGVEEWGLQQNEKLNLPEG